MQVDKASTVYFVCSGNTCRSPMAERLLRHALQVEPEPLKSLKVASCGINAYSGLPPSENSVFALSKVGIDLSDHRSQSVDDIDFSSAVAFFCMTQAHQNQLLNYWDVDPSKVFLVRQWVDSPPEEIPDPYGGGVRDYVHCRDAIVEAIPGIVNYLKANLKT